MKSFILIAFSAFIFGLTTNAQGLHHVQGINLAGISYGIAPGTQGTTNLFGINYSMCLQKKWILNLNGLYETGNIGTTGVKNYLFAGGADYTVFKAGNLLYFNTGPAILIGGETLNNPENAEKKNGFLFGLSGNINIELYLTDRIVFQVKAEQNYLPNSGLGKWYPAFYVGLKYCIF